MTDAVDAFHAAIYANPADPLPRLVYADWLDDRGEAEYAELIRIEDMLDRGRLTRDERRVARVRRWELNQQLYKTWRLADLGFGSPLLDRAGVLPDHRSVSAATLLRWEEWPPFLRPRDLTVFDYLGVEQEVVGCPFLARIERLSFCEPGEYQPAPPYPPDSDPLLGCLSRSRPLDRLRMLRLDVRPSRQGLEQFVESEFADRLPYLELVFVLWAYRDGPANYHNVDARQPPAGAVREAIRGFIDEYAELLPP